jgi:hypothetical protein
MAGVVAAGTTMGTRTGTGEAGTVAEAVTAGDGVAERRQTP